MGNYKGSENCQIVGQNAGESLVAGSQLAGRAKRKARARKSDS